MTPTQFLLFAAALTSVILAEVTSASPSQHRPFTIASSPSRKAGGEADGGEAVSEVSSVVECPARHYYSPASMACRPCSPCPVNLIIRAPCSASHDTRCGPFFEFDKFHQSPVQPSPAGDGPHSGGRHPEDHHRQHHHSSEETAGGSDLTSVALARAGNQWRTLSFALIIVLSLICTIVIVVGIYVCVMCRRPNAQKRLVTREPELLVVASYPDDREPRYVDTYVTSRDRLRTPRHLPVYQQIYTGGDTLEFAPLTSLATDAVLQYDVTAGNTGKDWELYVNNAIKAAES